MRYFVGFLIAIGLIILIIVLLFGGSGDSGKSKVATSSKTLASYANTDAEASMTIDGPVNADQDHRLLKVTVGQNSVVYQEFTGYNGQVIQEKTYHNTEASYATFLRALELVSFTRGNNDSKLADERGRCPLGQRSVFEFKQGNHSFERLWVTSCGGAKTYLGSTQATIQLFKQQVPDYLALSTDLGF